MYYDFFSSFARLKHPQIPMEQLLHYVWKHKMFPLSGLKTTDGHTVEVIDTGLHNMNSGPDFFNAKLKIGDTMWVGNVEIHEASSDWYVHKHDKDAAYDNVILHIAGIVDTDVCTGHSKRTLPRTAANRQLSPVL